MTEEWRPIKGFPGYQISSLGRVQSFKRNGLFGTLLSASRKNKKSRAMVTLYVDGEVHYRLVSRLVCAAFHGDAPSKSHQACHKDGNKDRDHADNLAWKTPKENMEDRDLHGRTGRGENHYAAKTTEAVVLQIRHMHAEKKHLNRHYGAIPALAKQFGMTTSAVEDIINRRKWRHI